MILHKIAAVTAAASLGVAGGHYVTQAQFNALQVRVNEVENSNWDLLQQLSEEQDYTGYLGEALSCYANMWNAFAQDVQFVDDGSCAYARDWKGVTPLMKPKR